MRLLFAEDDPSLASVVVDLLREEDHEVVHVDDLATASARAKEDRWDLFVIDLPSRSSFALHPDDRALLQALARRAPVILATGRPWAERVEAADLELAAILPKPYDLDTLLDAIERATTT